jgi:hypothetical protein
MRNGVSGYDFDFLNNKKARHCRAKRLNHETGLRREQKKTSMSTHEETRLELHAHTGTVARAVFIKADGNAIISVLINHLVGNVHCS